MEIQMNKSTINHATGALLLALLSGPAAAAFVYEYHPASNFDVIEATVNLDVIEGTGGGYTVDDFVTVSFTVDTRLPQMTYQDISSMVTSFSFYDNHGTITDASATESTFHIGVNGSGGIFTWHAEANIDVYEAAATRDEEWSIGTTSTDSVDLDFGLRQICQGECSFLVAPLERSYGEVQFKPGGWSVTETSAVPVPAAVWLFGSGLLGLVGVARRKKA